MLFCTKEYLFFFVMVFFLYWSLPWQRVRVWFLLLCSFFFYAVWSKELACIIVVTTVLDYWIARGMDACKTTSSKKGLLILSLVMNLGLLVYFKYANFFLESLHQSLELMGVQTSLVVLNVILPIGISFYTFEAINYTVDVYRGKIRAERDLGAFMLFILFFPHLVAGPIVRAKDFLPQIHRPKRFNWARIQLGLSLIILGLFKKLAIADRMAVLADPIFAEPHRFSTEALWMGMVAFAFQVYCDFSGYSDMALGSAHMLGYKLTLNFNMPFLSTNVTEFWKRWHISLSTWLRDYLFIPLGGSRGGFWKTNRNLLITMSLGGLWHGAQWNFVLWGVLQGVLLIIHRMFARWCGNKPRLTSFLHTAFGTLLRIGLTFLTFCFSLVVFRPQSLHDTGVMFTRLFIPSEGLSSVLQAQALWLTILLMLLAHLLGSWRRWKSFIFNLPEPIKGLAYGLIFLLALVMAPGNTKAFFYFAF